MTDRHLAPPHRRRTAPRPATALLCPGQGAYKPGALAGIRDLPHVRAVLHAVDSLHHRTHPVTHLLTDPAAPGPAELLACDPLAFDLATYTATVAAGIAIQEDLGHHPRIVMGHSVGDLAALAVSGVLTPTEGATVLHVRDELLVRIPHPPTGMLAVRAANDDTGELLQSAGLPHTHIAADNAPRQTVVSGPSPELDDLSRLADGLSIRTTRLDSRTGYHHPALAPIAQELLLHLRTLPPRRPTSSLYSSALAAPVHADHLLTATHHLTRPVRFRAALHSLQRMGITTFLDSGPGTLLAALAKATLPTAHVVAPFRSPLDAVRLHDRLERASEPR
ncbi:acyltransferase domain-containing protein [Streptomyces sp. NBC_00237]|uniref:ACP S-malonyltransferase n=1 Tax=Streptomyces sp. NBC_00237 TaxID=2975687 RepID=UPI00225B9206|nr:acyltransferase domain-containing protein [Streptomyces sp. NBC_00237]MCX5205971.1 acyltransferase domain-containing protein [Streptomyces sp. NBC_00237]